MGSSISTHTSIFVFVESEDKNEIVKKLDRDPTKVRRKDPQDRSPLHYAAARGSKEITELLIVRGGAVNGRDKDGRMPLHEACKNGHLVVAEMLIEQGAEVNNVDGNRSPIYDACLNGHLEIVEMLISKGANLALRTKEGTVSDAVENMLKESKGNEKLAAISKFLKEIS